MTNAFSIEVEWLPASNGPDEVRHTAASIEIAIGGRIATRAEDAWSKSVRRSARLSTYPLALWLASSWWRLRWETRLANTAGTAWRMSHETAAAGHGFLWPLLTFESDGHEISAVCRAAYPRPEEPLCYLESFRRAIPAPVFEQTVDEFVSLTLDRLDATGNPRTPLHDLWNEVKQERADPVLARMRRLEAGLGFEPDEAPDELLRKMESLSTTIGAAATGEIAPVCAGPNPAAMLSRIEEFSALPGIEAKFGLNLKVAGGAFPTPWESGWELAGEARKTCGLGDRAVSDTILADLLGMPADRVRETGPAALGPPLGLAIRGGDPSRQKLLFSKRNLPGRRFEAARFICSQISSPLEESWLPVTDSRTVLQKTQRAFAAEFLCPIEPLKEFLGGDFSPGRIEDAGEHFGVSDVAIASHLANHGQIPFEWAGA